MSRPVTSVQFVCTCNSQITRRHSRQRKFWAIIVMLYTRSVDYNQRPRVYIRYWPCKDEELHLPYIICWVCQLIHETTFQITKKNVLTFIITAAKK